MKRLTTISILDMKKLLVLTALAALFVLPTEAQEKKSPSFDEVITSRPSIHNYDATQYSI